jgi:hypothetical protein
MHVRTVVTTLAKKFDKKIMHDVHFFLCYTEGHVHVCIRTAVMHNECK